MRALGLGVLILVGLACFLLMEVVVAEDTFFLYPEKGTVEETHIFYIGEHEMRSCIILDGNATNVCYHIPDTPPLTRDVFNSHPRGAMNAGEPWVLDYGIGIQLNPYAPPGIYQLAIDLNYTDESNRTIIQEFEYEVDFRRALDVTEYLLRRGATNSLELRVVTFVDMEWLNVSIHAPGLGDQWWVRSRTDVPAGVHDFRATFQGDMVGDVDEVGHGYMIDAYVDGHEITLIDMNIGQELEIIDEPQSLLPLVLAALLLLGGALAAGLYLTRNRGGEGDSVSGKL